MEELKELIDQDAEKRAASSKALLDDLKLSLEYDGEVSAAMNITPRGPRQLLQLMLNADMARGENSRYGVTTVQSAWNKLSKYAPEYMEKLTRKYEKQNDK